MTRLRYSRQGNTIHTDWITIAPNTVVRGIVNIKNLNYMIIGFDSEVLFEGEGATLRHAKSLIRLKLEAAGVNFEGEIRNKQ